MEENNQMMHYPQGGYGGGMGGLGDQQQQQGPTSPQSPGDGQDGVRGHASINNILDQIMTITDQSLDEVRTDFLQPFKLRYRFR